MDVMSAGPGKGAVCNELVLLQEVARKGRSVFAAVGFGEEGDLLVVGLVGRKSGGLVLGE